MKNILTKFTQLSLKVQLVYGIGLLLSIILSILSYMQISEQNSFIRSKAIQTAAQHSSAFSSMVKVWVMSNDYVGLEESLEHFSVYDDLIFATVVNMDGKIITHSDKSLIGKYIADKKRISFLKSLHGKNDSQINIFSNENHIDVFRIIQHKNQLMGFTHLRFNESSLEEQISYNINRGIGFILLYLTISLILLYFIVNIFTKQLESLLQTIKQVHSGNKKIRASIKGSRELEILSTEFNTMLDSIESTKQEIEKIKEQLEYAVNGTQDGLWDWNLETNEVYFSPRWKEMVGYKDDELPNVLESWSNNVHPDDYPKAEKDVIFSHQAPNRLYENLHRFRHKDGHWVWILARGQTIFNEDGECVRMVGFHTDMTKQKGLEEELLDQKDMMIAQSRLAQMGEMISMIAHQWRQPLGSISATAISAELKLDLNSFDLDTKEGQEQQNIFLKERLHNIENLVQNLSNTIDDFRNFYKPNKKSILTNFETLITKCLGILKDTFDKDNINVVFEYHSHQEIPMYDSEMMQVILNILKNAQDNFKEQQTKNPTITITTENTNLIICDNGGGISKEILPKIFDPYFSTKDDKNGTGLGLYMSKTIVEEHHHGLLKAYNKNDDNTCFEIQLNETDL